MSDPKEKKERVDKLLVDQGVARSRTHAQALIMAGQICLGDQLIKKSSETFIQGTQFRIKSGVGSRFVSRGGEKLQGALEKMSLQISGFKALDIGMSTGGFTDCLLQNGAESVIGLDVGHNQLAWELRNDPRVKFHEGINCRQIPEDLVPELVDLIVVDVSFISLTLILKEAFKFLKPEGILLALIKPQFEVERNQVGKGGIVKDPLLHMQVQDKINRFCGDLGFSDLQIFSSPIEGTDGNKEFFIFGRSPKHFIFSSNNETP